MWQKYRCGGFHASRSGAGVSYWWNHKPLSDWSFISVNNGGTSTHHTQDSHIQTALNLFTPYLFFKSDFCDTHILLQLLQLRARTDALAVHTWPNGPGLLLLLLCVLVSSDGSGILKHAPDGRFTSGSHLWQQASCLFKTTKCQCCQKPGMAARGVTWKLSIKSH